MADVQADLDPGRLREAIGGMEARGTFGYTVDYAKYVNYPTAYAGTQPPFTPIREWVHRKWNDLDSGLKDAAFRDGMSTEDHKDAVAWIVVNAIAENGTEGVYFMERATAEVERQAEAFAARYEGTDDPDAPFKVVRDLLDAAFGISQDIVADEATDTGNLLQSGFVDVETDGNLSYEQEGSE